MRQVGFCNVYISGHWHFRSSSSWEKYKQKSSRYICHVWSQEGQAKWFKCLSLQHVSRLSLYQCFALWKIGIWGSPLFKEEAKKQPSRDWHKVNIMVDTQHSSLRMDCFSFGGHIWQYSGVTPGWVFQELFLADFGAPKGSLLSCEIYDHPTLGIFCASSQCAFSAGFTCFCNKGASSRCLRFKLGQLHHLAPPPCLLPYCEITKKIPEGSQGRMVKILFSLLLWVS